MFWKKRNKKNKLIRIEFPDVLKNEKLNHRNIEFYNALFSLTEDSVTMENSLYLIKIYHSTKLHEMRNKSLKLLYNKDFEHLEDFFIAAYKREGYLDMKILALRGLAQFKPENEIEKILLKFNAVLKRRPEKTPCNYKEYELLKGKNSLPYLLKRYKYDCFIETLNIVEKQYNEMPDAFKGHFTVDESGEIISLRSKEKSSEMMNNYFETVGTR
ncbi:hypothetical protein [Seonamhaeicola maritimus]|uniref:Uncharacterized protein n=1 Tax=Seonamhaeicola maritimus TaxID=2591822 RepID=A0A5C7GLZ8_9FLAO|nr:hypothetical protein [Seonamhaeicola maritimus]TXG39314.1 hypothetical protein FUA22_05410 [Seonamhaeicola maritimus]